MNPTTTREDAPLDLDALALRFAEAARSLYPDCEPEVNFETPRRPEHGDLTTNMAFGLAKSARKAPAKISAEIAERVMSEDAVRATILEATPVAGFINLRLVPAYWQRVVRRVLAEGEAYGASPKNGARISLEFGSANPTGPLAVVQGRTLAVGDTLAKTMRLAGFDVFTEWIINDTGGQMIRFGSSVYARYRQLWDAAFPFPEDGYAGEYIVPLAEALRDRDGDTWVTTFADDAVLDEIGWFARGIILAQQQADARRFGVEYDLWQSERELHQAGAVERGTQRLRERGVLYEKDGATWVRTTDSGDDEDRVLVRADGRPTYLAGDVAYHYDKLQRADKVIDILGPDHHGYIARLHALADAYGRPGDIDVIIAQQITLKRGDEIVSMSKRAGTLITLSDVMDDVGVDAARFFFVMLSTDQPLTFDLELAKQTSNDNPVFYVQYGHARIASVLRRAHEQAPQQLAAAAHGEHLERLVEPAELALVRRLADFGATVSGVARARAPHRLPQYARQVAADFHVFYDQCRVLTDDAELSTARLALCLATKTVLATTLHLCGVSAPEQMEREAPPVLA
jgi:arginyl-tRNA synthetase